MCIRDSSTTDHEVAAHADAERSEIMSMREDPEVASARQVYLNDAKQASFLDARVRMNDKREAMKARYHDLAATRQYLANTRAPTLKNDLV
eukprot:7534404-Alexandrium_andersonii.AAC.1